MHFEFYGETIANIVIDPAEFDGMSREDIARELHDIALDAFAEAYFSDGDQFFDAADEVLNAPRA